jgi:hypothetical protein
LGCPIGSVVVFEPDGDEIRVVRVGVGVMTHLGATTTEQVLANAGSTMRLTVPDEGVDLTLTEVTVELAVAAPANRTVARPTVPAYVAASPAVPTAVWVRVAMALVVTFGEMIVLGVAAGTFVAIAAGSSVAVTTTIEIIATVSLVTVGGFLMVKLPWHPVGWLLWTSGLLLAINAGASGLANEGLTVHPGNVPSAIWFAWLGTWTGAPGLFLTAGMVPLLFPTGRPPSRRWLPVVIGGLVVLAASGLIGMVAPFTPGTYPVGVENPLVLRGPMGDLLSLAGNASKLFFLVIIFPLAVASLVVRYERATAIAQAQLRPFAWVAAVIVSALFLAFIGAGEWAWGIAGIGATLMPVTIGIACCAMASMTSTGSSAGPSPTACYQPSWLASSLGASSSCRPRSRRSRSRTTWPWRVRRCWCSPFSNPSADGCSAWSTGASTAVATMPSGRSLP